MYRSSLHHHRPFGLHLLFGFTVLAIILLTGGCDGFLSDDHDPEELTSVELFSGQAYPDYTLTLTFDSTRARVWYHSDTQRIELQNGVPGKFPSFEAFRIIVDPLEGYYFYKWADSSWEHRAQRHFLLDEDKELEVELRSLPAAEDRMLLMLYYATAHDLEDMALGSISSMAYDYGYMLTPEERSRLTLLIFYDDLGEVPGESCYLMELSPNTAGTGLLEMEIDPWWDQDPASASTETLEAFLSYADTHYTDYGTRGLIISGHGSGYRGVSSRSIARNIAYESDPPGASMTIHELQQALQNQACGPDTLDILGLNMCSSGSFEDYYELRDTTRYFIGCPWIQTGFWNAWGFIDEIAQAQTPEELAKAIAWVGFYKNAMSQREETDNALSVLDTTGSEAIRTAINHLAAELAALPKSQIEAIFDPLYAPAGGAASRYALGRICGELVTQGIAAEAAQNVIDTFSAMAVYSWADLHVGNYEGENLAEGLVISFPDQIDGYDQYAIFEDDYNDSRLDFYHADENGIVESWTELLNSLYSDQYGY